MRYQDFIIDKNYKSIYLFLKSHGFSENFIKNLRKKMGNFILNDKAVPINAKLSEGDILKINSNPNEKTAIMQCVLPLDIVYEDEYYLLMNKPANISCMPNKSHYDHNLAGAICFYMNQKDDNFVLRMLNRLDKDTSGLILVAKDSIAQNMIKDIEKIYHAICLGRVDKSIIIDKKIQTTKTAGLNDRKRIISNDGKDAKTFIYPISFNDMYSLLKIKILHGRTHQIRIHSASINHPLLGDELYGQKSDIIPHQALVCKEISFFHPFLEKKLKFSIDYPLDFQIALEKANLL